MLSYKTKLIVKLVSALETFLNPLKVLVKKYVQRCNVTAKIHNYANSSFTMNQELLFPQYSVQFIITQPTDLLSWRKDKERWEGLEEEKEEENKRGEEKRNTAIMFIAFSHTYQLSKKIQFIDVQSKDRC